MGEIQLHSKRVGPPWAGIWFRIILILGSLRFTAGLC
jgi:hypothetical protein